jgi:hypothetical protein
MIFRIQFLDAAAAKIAEWLAEAPNTIGAVRLLEDEDWPACAERMQILAPNRRLVHWRAKAEQNPRLAR